MNTPQRQLLQLLVLAILCRPHSGVAQVAELLARWRADNPLHISGSVSSSLQTNAIRGIAARADAFSLRAQANLLVRYMGIKAPLAFAWSDGNATYRLPSYRLLGVSPTYKWISLHAGDRSMPLSNYSLSNHNIRGLGIELKPGHWFAGILGGRIQTYRPEDADALQSQAATYQRHGWGARAGYDDGKRRLAVHAFRARDRDHRLADSLSRAVLGPPKENMIVGIQWRQALSKRFYAETEAARSILTRDTESPAVSGRGLIRRRISTGTHNAWTAKLSYRPRKGSYQLAYEHIDPGYQSLGALFFNNDLRRASLGAQCPLRNDRIQLDAKLGLEQNGLRPRAGNQQQRLVSALTAAARLSGKTNLHASWSNFSLTQHYRLTRVPVVDVDTIIWLQTNCSFTMSLQTLTGKQASDQLSISMSLQRARVLEDERPVAEQENQFINAQISYHCQLREDRWQWHSSWLINHNRTATAAHWMTGPTTTLRLQGKRTVNTGLSWLQQGGAGLASTRIIQSWIETEISLAEKQHLSLRIAHMRAGSSGVRPVRDWNLALQYRYSWQ